MSGCFSCGYIGVYGHKFLGQREEISLVNCSVSRYDLKGTSFTCIFPEEGNKLHGSREKQASERRMDLAEEFYEDSLMQMLHCCNK